MNEKINNINNTININDITDLSLFNKSLGTSRGIGKIGLRNTKTLFEKTDVIVRSILSQTDNLNDGNDSSEEFCRLSKLYGCGVQGAKKVKKIVSRKPKSNEEMFRYKPSDWDSIQNKLWSSHLFKDIGVQILEDYQQQVITLPKLHSLLEYSLQLKFTQREIAALVNELRCTNIVFGEYTIQYPQLLTELKLLGNIIRSTQSSQQIQQQLYHQQQQHIKEEIEQFVPPPHILANSLNHVQIDRSILYSTLRNISSACISAWKKEKAYFIKLLHEIPTGTLDTESLREFFSYNINIKLNIHESTSVIYYFNGSLHRFSNTISLSDLVKDMKLLALQMPSAILAPPSAPITSSSSTTTTTTTNESLNLNNIQEEWYNHWCNQKVRKIEDYFHHESQRILGTMSNAGGSAVGSNLNRIKKNKYLKSIGNYSRINNDSDNTDNEDNNDNNSNENENIDNNNDDDKTISTLGMESVDSIPKKILSKKNITQVPLLKNHLTHKVQLKDKNLQNQKRHSNSQSSSILLSPIKHSSRSLNSTDTLSTSSLKTLASSISPQSSVVDFQGKVQSIHYNLASPYIYSSEALNQKNKILKQIEDSHNIKSSDSLENSDSESIESKEKNITEKGKNKSLSFAFGAAMLMKAHHAKVTLAGGKEVYEENKKIKEVEKDNQSVMSDTSSNNSSHSVSTFSRMGLPTNIGYYELHGGSTILRAKTPMYLIRPVNSSDSVMALSNGKGVLRLKSLSEENDDLSIHSSSSSSSIISTNQSNTNTLKLLEKIKKKREKERDHRVLSTIRSELECGSLDEKGIGLRYELRYQQVAEFIRYYKMNSLKLHLDEILVALWNDVQNRTGRGLDTMCEGGIAIDRQYFVSTLHEIFPLYSESNCQLLFSSLDPLRRGYIPCHTFHSIISVPLLKSGSSVEMIVYTSIRAAVWEYLNTNRDIREFIKPIVSSLSTLNNTYLTRKELYLQSQSQSSTHNNQIPQQTYPTDTFQTSEEYNLERWIIYHTYIPSQVVILCIRSLCLQPQTELNLINKLNNFIKNNNINLIKNNLINESQGKDNNNGNISKLSTTSTINYHLFNQNPNLIKENHEKFMKPPSINYILIQDLISFLCHENIHIKSNTDNNNNTNNVNNDQRNERNEVYYIILSEFKKLHKLIKKYFYKTNEKK